METVWHYRSLTMLGQIKFWQWLGRLAPMVSLLVLVLTLFLEPTNWKEYVLIAVASGFGCIAFVWWWWVIYAVKNLTDMLHKSREDFLKVIEDISKLRSDMHSTRKTRIVHNDPDKDLNKPKD